MTGILLKTKLHAVDSVYACQSGLHPYPVMNGSKQFLPLDVAKLQDVSMHTGRSQKHKLAVHMPAVTKAGAC